MNYYEIKSISFRYKTIAYIDVMSYKADYLFCKKGIKLKFIKDFSNEINDYILVIAKVKKKDFTKFKECMKELYNQMILIGYSDYDKECNNFTKVLREEGL